MTLNCGFGSKWWRDYCYCEICSISSPSRLTWFHQGIYPLSGALVCLCVQRRPNDWLENLRVSPPPPPIALMAVWWACFELSFDIRISVGVNASTSYESALSNSARAVYPPDKVVEDAWDTYLVLHRLLNRTRDPSWRSRFGWMSRFDRRRHSDCSMYRSKWWCLFW